MGERGEGEEREGRGGGRRRKEGEREIGRQTDTQRELDKRRG